MPPVVNIGTVVGTYTTPAVHVKVSGMLTNTHCTSPYRGAGRPEASYMIERLIDTPSRHGLLLPAEAAVAQQNQYRCRSFKGARRTQSDNGRPDTKAH